MLLFHSSAFENSVCMRLSPSELIIPDTGHHHYDRKPAKLLSFELARTEQHCGALSYRKVNLTFFCTAEKFKDVLKWGGAEERRSRNCARKE